MPLLACTYSSRLLQSLLSAFTESVTPPAARHATSVAAAKCYTPVHLQSAAAVTCKDCHLKVISDELETKLKRKHLALVNLHWKTSVCDLEPGLESQGFQSELLAQAVLH